MENAIGTVFRYGDNVDTDVIIPARYLNSSDPAEPVSYTHLSGDFQDILAGSFDVPSLNPEL